MTTMDSADATDRRSGLDLDWLGAGSLGRAREDTGRMRTAVGRVG
jgi:hypothetical protein